MKLFILEHKGETLSVFSVYLFFFTVQWYAYDQRGKAIDLWKMGHVNYILLSKQTFCFLLYKTVKIVWGILIATNF